MGTSRLGKEDSSNAPPTRSAVVLLAFVLFVGFIAGLLLIAATVGIERAGIHGDGWSLRGNGALIVPACGLPVILVVGWALLARRLHADRLSCLVGIGASIAALLISLVPLFSSAREISLLIFTAALGLAAVWTRNRGRARIAARLMAAALLFVGAVLAGMAVGTAVLK